MSKNIQTIDYLVGGLRISLGPGSTTPGPKTHIRGFTEALQQKGLSVQFFLASRVPGLGRFARVSEGATIARMPSRARLLALDAVRIAAALWGGLYLFATRVGKRQDVIYERVAVYQSLASFHPGKRGAIRVVESNGLMSLETAAERNAIAWVGLAAAIEKRVYRRADLVVVVSERLGESVINFAGVDARKILVVPNGIDADLLLGNVRPEHGRFGFVGSVVGWQRVGLLVEALAAHGGRFSLDVVGDGPELINLQTLCEEYGVSDSVHFHGRLPRNQAIELMRTWHVGYSGHGSTSDTEMYHSPLKLYEYAGLGMAIIASQSPDAASLSEAGAEIYTFTSSSELKRIVSRVLADDLASPELIEERRAAIGASHSWHARVSRFLSWGGES